MATATRPPAVTVSTPEREQADATACPECAGRVRPDGVDRVCAACGLVVARHPTDHGHRFAERYDRDARHPYAGGKATDRDLGDRGLGSQLTFGPGASSAERRRARIQHHATAGSKFDRNRAYATVEIGRMATALDAGAGVAPLAKRLFRRAHDDGQAVGDDLDALAAACVYTAVRVRQRGVTAAEVADVAHASEAAIMRRHRRVSAALGVAVPPPAVEARLRRVASRVGVGDGVLRRAVDRLRALDGEAVCEGSPSTLAAALLYDAGVGVTQEAVADAAGVTATGLRKRLARLG